MKETIGPFKALFSDAVDKNSVMVVPRGADWQWVKRHHGRIRPGAILDATPEEMEALKGIRAIKLTVGEEE